MYIDSTKFNGFFMIPFDGFYPQKKYKISISFYSKDKDIDKNYSAEIDLFVDQKIDDFFGEKIIADKDKFPVITLDTMNYGKCMLDVFKKINKKDNKSKQFLAKAFFIKPTEGIIIDFSKIALKYPQYSDISNLNLQVSAGIQQNYSIRKLNNHQILVDCYINDIRESVYSPFIESRILLTINNLEKSKSREDSFLIELNVKK